jgi:hypothetical protein
MNSSGTILGDVQSKGVGGVAPGASWRLAFLRSRGSIGLFQLVPRRDSERIASASSADSGAVPSTHPLFTTLQLCAEQPRGPFTPRQSWNASRREGMSIFSTSLGSAHQIAWHRFSVSAHEVIIAYTQDHKLPLDPFQRKIAQVRRNALFSSASQG